MKKIFKIAILVIVLIVSVNLAERALLRVGRIIFPLKYEEAIEKYSREYGLSPDLVMGVISAESKFSPGAHSGVAKGLMQITDETAKEISEKIGLGYSEDMAYNPEKNINMGCYYLAYLNGLYEDIDTALAAYNAGPGKVKEWLLDKRYSEDGVTLSEIPYPETRDYIKRVHQLSEVYQKLY